MKNDDFLRQLGARLKAERRKAGLSQDTVARALGQTASSGHAYVSRLEQGKFGDIGFGGNAGTLPVLQTLGCRRGFSPLPVRF